MTSLADTLTLFRRESPVTVLGPGKRAVIWTQGCPFACPGCIVPESWDARDGTTEPLDSLAEWILSREGIEGITLSGGEPVAQAGALARLIDRVRNKADLGVVCYTGYTYERLTARRRPDQIDLLLRVDLLIDGLYIERLHADRLWRGSSNQRLLPLTERYRSRVEAIEAEGDRSAGLEFFLDDAGVLGYAGVPPQPGFDTGFRERMQARGVLWRGSRGGTR